MKHRDLESTRQLIKDATGLDLAYAYDDLVFPEHTVFFLQFNDNNPSSLNCFFRKDCEKSQQTTILNELKNSGIKYKCTIVSKGSFDFLQKGENIEIVFYK